MCLKTPCRQGVEYVDCIPCRGVNPPPPNRDHLLAVGGDP